MIFISCESLEFYIRGAVKSGFLNRLFDESLLIYCHDLCLCLCLCLYLPIVTNIVNTLDMPTNSRC